METMPELLSIFLIDFPEYKIRLTHLFDKIDDVKLQHTSKLLVGGIQVCCQN